jgi:hypothetical protein
MFFLVEKKELPNYKKSTPKLFDILVLPFYVNHLLTKIEEQLDKIN